MDRRDFLKSTLASLTLPGSALTLAFAASSHGNALSHVFYDERFQAAETLSREIAGSADIVPVRGEAFSLLERRSDLTPDYIKTIVRQGLRTMPGFKPTTITHQELDALAGYLGK